MAADEGSSGWAVFGFLAHFNFRVMFQRDPCHRLSNVFVKTLRSVPAIMQVVFDLLLVFKFRRAPFGGGKFLRESMQSLQLLTKHAGLHHPLIDQLRDQLCRDIGASPEGAELDPSILRNHFDKCIKQPVGSSSKHPRSFASLACRVS